MYLWETAVFFFWELKFKAVNLKVFLLKFICSANSFPLALPANVECFYHTILQQFLQFCCYHFPKGIWFVCLFWKNPIFLASLHLQQPLKFLIYLCSFPSAGDSNLIIIYSSLQRILMKSLQCASAHLLWRQGDSHTEVSKQCLRREKTG